MSELIDRKALLDECLNHYEVGNIEQNCTMDWICKTVRNFPAAPRWHRVEEPPKEEGRYWFAVWFDGHWIFDAAWYTHDISTVIDVLCCERVGGFYKGNTEVHPDYWMPIEPPKEGK